MSWKVIQVYITAMGGLLRFGLLMTWFVLVELCRVGATVWLSYWTGVTEDGAGRMELHEAAWNATVCQPEQICFPAVPNQKAVSCGSAGYQFMFHKALVLREPLCG